MIVRWGPNEGGWLIRSFKATITYSNHWKWALVCWSIDLRKQDPFSQFSSAFGLDHLSLLISQVFAYLKTEAINFSADEAISAFFRTGEEGFSLYVDHIFYSSSKPWNPKLILGQETSKETVSDFPVMRSAWCTFVKVSEDAGPTKQNPTLCQVHCVENSQFSHKICQIELAIWSVVRCSAERP